MTPEDAQQLEMAISEHICANPRGSISLHTVGNPPLDYDCDIIGNTKVRGRFLIIDYGIALHWVALEHVVRVRFSKAFPPGA